MVDFRVEEKFGALKKSFISNKLLMNSGALFQFRVQMALKISIIKFTIKQPTETIKLNYFSYSRTHTLEKVKKKVKLRT